MPGRQEFVCVEFLGTVLNLYSFVSLDRVLYSPERLASIGTEAAKGDAVFSLRDRIGLVHDAYALAQAGFSKVSSALTLVHTLKDEKECQFQSFALKAQLFS